MNQLEIRGRIYPDHKPFSLVTTTKLKCGNETRDFIGFTGDLEIIFGGQDVKAIFTITEGTFDKINEILNFARSNVRAMLDIWCFLEPLSYEFHLETFHFNEKNGNIPFEINVKLRSITKSYNFNDIFDKALKTPELRRALNSLRLSLQHPYNLALFTYQAIEAVRHYFERKNGSNNKTAWMEMNKALNIENGDWFTEIKQLSEEQRHGGHEDISGVQQDKFAKQAWEVTQRFIELLERDIEQLPIQEFPILK